MKTKTLIIIGSILIFGIILVTDVSQSQLEWNKVIEEDRIKHDESTSLNCAEGYIVSEGKCIIDCGVNNTYLDGKCQQVTIIGNDTTR